MSRGYSVKRGTEMFDDLTATGALAKANELSVEDSGEIYLFDPFGDPMGWQDLQLDAAYERTTKRFPKTIKRLAE